MQPPGQPPAGVLTAGIQRARNLWGWIGAAVRGRRTKASTRYRTLLVLACFAATFTSYVERVGFSLSLTLLADEARLDQAAKGAALGSFYWGYALSQVPGAAVAQRFGGGRVLAFSFMSWSLASALTPADPRAVARLAFARVCVGVAQGLVIPSLHGVLASQIPPASRAKSVSLSTSGMYLGSAFAMATLPAAAHAWGASSLPRIAAALGFLWLLGWRALQGRRGGPLARDAGGRFHAGGGGGMLGTGHARRLSSLGGSTAGSLEHLLPLAAAPWRGDGKANGSGKAAYGADAAADGSDGEGGWLASPGDGRPSRAGSVAVDAGSPTRAGGAAAGGPAALPGLGVGSPGADGSPPVGSQRGAAAHLPGRPGSDGGWLSRGRGTAVAVPHPLAASRKRNVSFGSQAMLSTGAGTGGEPAGGEGGQGTREAGGAPGAPPGPDGGGPPATPWRRILAHPAVWAIATNNFTFHYAFYVVMGWMPTLFSARLGVELASLGRLPRTLPYLAMFFTSNLGGAASDRLIAGVRLRVPGLPAPGPAGLAPPPASPVRRCRVVTARRTVNAAGFSLAALALALIPSASTPAQGVLATTLTLAACGFARGGFSVNHMDIAPRYASAIMGISNTAGTVAGILGNWATGALLDRAGGPGEAAGWHASCRIASLLCLLGVAVFSAFARGDKIFPD